MSKKNLLNESTVRRFMRLAELRPLTSEFVKENYPPMADDDEPTPEEAEFDAAYEEEGEEEGFDAGVEAAEDEDLGVDVEDDEVAAEGPDGELTLTDEEAEVFLKVADKVRAAMEGGEAPEEIGEPDMGGDDEMDMDAEVEMDAEVDMGDEGEDIDVEEEEVELAEESSDKWGHGKKEFKRHRDAAGKETKTGDVGGGKYGKGGHYKDYEDDEDDLHEDKPYTAKKEKPGADKRKGAEKRGAEGTKKKTSGKGRGEKKGDDAYVNEELVNEIARRVAQKVLRAKTK